MRLNLLCGTSRSSPKYYGNTYWFSIMRMLRYLNQMTISLHGPVEASIHVHICLFVLQSRMREQGGMEGDMVKRCAYGKAVRVSH